MPPKRIEPPAGQSSTKDSWDKAQIVSGFISSVALAGIALWITSAIQKSQIASGEATARAVAELDASRADADRKVQQGALTAQLLQQLAGSNRLQREIAIVALELAGSDAAVQRILSIVAQSDDDPRIRGVAIEKLAESSDPAVTRTLADISTRNDRATGERLLAQSSSRETAVRQFAPSKVPTLLLASGSSGSSYFSEDLNDTVFAHYLSRAIGGGADFDKDGRVTSAETVRFLNVETAIDVREYSDRGLREPFFAISGEPNTAWVGTGLKFPNAVIVFIAISDYDDGIAFEPGSTSDIMTKLRTGLKADFVTRRGGDAVRLNVLSALQEAEAKLRPGGLLIVAFSGKARINPEGIAEWVLYSRERQEVFGSHELRSLLTATKAGYRVLLMNVSWPEGVR